MSNSLRPHGLQHARLPCPSPTPRVYSNSCPSSWWYNLPISYSVIPFSSCLQSFLSIRVFSSEGALPISWPKYWSFSFSIRLSNEYWRLILFNIDWFDLLSVQGTLKSLQKHHRLKASIIWCSPSLGYTSHICSLLLEKSYHWLYGHLLTKWCLCFWIQWLYQFTFPPTV